MRTSESLTNNKPFGTAICMDFAIIVVSHRQQKKVLADPDHDRLCALMTAICPYANAIFLRRQVNFEHFLIRHKFQNQSTAWRVERAIK